MIQDLDCWTTQADNHLERMRPFADAFLERRKNGLTHAIHDFLFTYYSMSPTKLKQWIPALSQQLKMTEELRAAYPWLNSYWFECKDGLLSHNRQRLHKGITELALFVSRLCENILKQPPRFGCFGLHEWAMLYRSSSEDIRHHRHSLRLPQEELNRFVESQQLCCSHYDAFRFFTTPAKPLNIHTPTLDSRLQMEQGGCLHANMDLYKWSTKLWPWIGSDFLAKTFLLALDAREIDMRASPYDLSNIGYPPIHIETEEGRKLYQKEQQRLAEQAIPLRKELLAFCEQII